jgi:hypothetical protein
VVPWRWIAERTFAWLGRYRRLKSDYECLPETTESLVHIARPGGDAFESVKKSGVGEYHRLEGCVLRYLSND